MAESTIPVDLFNPGQVFACIGLMELADLLLGDARGGFDWSADADTRFRWSASGIEEPLRAALEFLQHGEQVTILPSRPALEFKARQLSVAPAEGTAFPIRPPDKPPTLPVRIRNGLMEFWVTYWGDSTNRDNVKFWAGAAGYPGAGLLRDATVSLSGRWDELDERPFDIAAPQSSSFRFDFRGDYVPLSAGFSRNAHADMQSQGYPFVEILAAVGMTHARPARTNPRSKLEYAYGVLGAQEVPLALHRAALGGAPLPFLTRRFRMRLDWPGQENQARCITDVTEIPIDSNPQTSR